MFDMEPLVLSATRTLIILTCVAGGLALVAGLGLELAVVAGSFSGNSPTGWFWSVCVIEVVTVLAAAALVATRSSRLRG
jgi:hypothetical protein